MSCRSNPTSPSSGSGAASTPSTPVASCPYSQSEVLLIDEIGLPMGNVAVVVRLSDGTTLNTTTDADGKICFSTPPGTTGEIELADIHESHSGDSTTTASGQHFAAGGSGP